MSIDIDMIHKGDVLQFADDKASFIVADIDRQKGSFFVVKVGETIELSSVALQNSKDLEYTTLDKALSVSMKAHATSVKK